MQDNRPDAKPADSFIRFACSFCGQKIRMQAKYAGKKGKCPKCGNIVVIPEIPVRQPSEKPGEHIRLNRNLDPRHISKASVPDAQSDAMDDIERHLQPPPDQQQITPEQKQLLNLWSERFPGQDEPEPESDLPWFIDLLAYPFNVSGIIHLFLFWAIPVLLSLTQPFFMFTPYGALLWLILAVFFWGYVFYYLFRCLIASAKGKHRAPDISLEDPPRPSDLVRQLLLILACIALCFAPMALYWSYTNRWQSDVTYLPVIFYTLLGGGAFLFPMLLLALAMFDSLYAFNPILIIPSICSTLAHYCGLVILFCAIGYLIYLIPFWRRGWSILFWMADIYLLFIAFHLLGMFYCRYEDKLNWEIKL